MGDGAEVLLNLLVWLGFGGITAAVARSKGRNAVGWFFIGLVAGCIGIIIVACLPNLNEERAKWDANEIEQRRLREQLRQEQLKNEAMRQHTAARLDQHDEKLGMDTRATSPGLSLAPTTRPTLLGSPPAVPPPGYLAENWYSNEDGGQQGPFTFTLLNSRARQGTLSPETLVWAQGMSDWQPAGTVPNLFPV